MDLLKIVTLIVILLGAACGATALPGGLPCAGDGDCIDGRRCVAATCRWPEPLHASCTEDRACASELCHGPEGRRTCEESGSRAVGVSCHLAEVCRTGVCTFPSATPGAPGRCVLENGAAEDCTADEMCRYRSVCRRAAPDGPRRCTDTFAQAGEACERSSECSASEDLICAGGRCVRRVGSPCPADAAEPSCQPNTSCICGVCSPPLGLGGCCTSSDHCAGELECREGACAQPPGQAGDPCTVDASGMTTCAPSLACRNGRCVPAQGS